MSSFKFRPAVQDLPCVHQGKVRDTFSIPGHPNLRLTVATDRVSTHNVIHLSEVPLKGQALTALTVFAMTDCLPGIKTHLVAYGRKIYDYLPPGTYPADLHLRAIVILVLDMIDVEFVFRSRMAGSLWKDFYSKNFPNPYGFDLLPGMKLMSPFDGTKFTPTDKSATDDPLNTAETIERYGAAYRLTLQAYEAGRAFALTRGIEIIDGKFEAGVVDGEVVIGDECLTPDACRFVRADGIIVGQEPSWLDKEYLRAAAEAIWAGGKKIPLTFDQSVLDETSARYSEIVQALTGSSPQAFQAERY